MSHGEGWQFIQMGRYLERAAAIANLLGIYHAEMFSGSEEADRGTTRSRVGRAAALLHRI